MIIKIFEEFKSVEFWDAVDQQASLIKTKGYGRPIKHLIENVPEFGIVKYGKKICDCDVLFDRWYKLKKENKVLKNVTIGEKIVMLLMNWGSNRDGFDANHNPDNLKFSEWVKKPIKIYRGVESATIVDNPIMSEKDYYSFSLSSDIAELFTISNYARGGYTTRRKAKGYVFVAEVAPIDFHIYMANFNESECIIKNTTKIETKLYKTIDNTNL